MLGVYYVPGRILQSFFFILILILIRVLEGLSCSWIGTIIFPFLQMRKLRYREIKLPAPNQVVLSQAGILTQTLWLWSS